MNSSSNWTGRTPRNLNDAFGPHTSHDVQPMPHPVSRTDRVLGVLLAVALGIFGALALVHYVAKGY